MKPMHKRSRPACLADLRSSPATLGSCVLSCVLLLAGVSGCSTDRDRLESPGSGLEQFGDVGSGFGGAHGSRLLLSVDDPDAWYAGAETHPWYQYSTVTHAESFTLRVTNQSRGRVKDVQLLVALPGDLAEYGWSVTIGNPGVVYTLLSEFDHTLLGDTHYPKVFPHQVYWREGNARFLLIPGPTFLDGGMTWEVPVQLYRGTTENFMVHFDVAGLGAYSNPVVDVTAQPPVNSGGGDFTERTPVEQ